MLRWMSERRIRGYGSLDYAVERPETRLVVATPPRRRPAGKGAPAGDERLGAVSAATSANGCGADESPDTRQDALAGRRVLRGQNRDHIRRTRGRADHPWIRFQLDPGPADPRLWALLGQIVTLAEFVSRAPLPPKVASEMARLCLARGVRATVAIEGNTLSEAEVLALIDGELDLPASKEYLGREVRNVVDAANEIVGRIRRGDAPRLTTGFVAESNRRILSGLTEVLAEEVRPGRLREHPVGVAGYRGAPARDCGYLLDRLGSWLEQLPRSRVLASDDDDGRATGVLRAVLAHLYIAWIHPFGDGNGRTARLVELALLARVLPFPSAHLLSNHYHDTRAAYYRELRRSSQANQRRGDPLGFVRYALQGLADGLREQGAEITRVHRATAWREFVFHRFDRERPSPAMRRRRQLLLELPPPAKPARKEQVRFTSPQITHLYAGLSPKTLIRDLNWLTAAELALHSPAGYHANLALLEAFAVPDAPSGRP